MDSHKSLLGLGLYSASEASRLTSVPAARIRRWMSGYSYRSGDGSAAASAPIWVRELAEMDELVITFRDLLELRFVDAFRRHGVSWKVIRTSAHRAAELFETQHPFSTKRFRTDGRRIFADVIHESGEEALLDLVGSQFGFKRILEPFLYRGLEFSEDEQTLVRWWPLGMRRRVVLDPTRSFGLPIDPVQGIRTSTLAAAFRAERSHARVASWFDTDVRAVRDAVAYEDSLAA